MKKLKPFLINFIPLILCISIFNSCSSENNEVIRLTPELFDWFTIYERRETVSYEYFYLQTNSLDTLSTYRDTQRITPNFDILKSKPCEEGFSPICEETFGSINIFTLLGKDNELLFILSSFPDHMNLLINNNEEIISKMPENADVIKKDFTEFKGKELQNCFEYNLLIPPTNPTKDISFLYCKEEGLIYYNKKATNGDNFTELAYSKID